MFALPLFVSLVVPFVVAQSNNTSIQIEAIEAHFKQANIVPALLSTFDPNATLTINFEGVGDLSPGQGLSQDQVAPTPTIKITPANSSVDLSGTFTLAMVDADVVGADESSVTRHWLVNSVTVSNGVVSNSSATAITEYAGPAPPSGSGPHRYVVLLLEQTSSFSAPSDFSQPNIGVSKFDFNGYVTDSHLGGIIAGNYFTVEVGTSTVSVSATSAVISSTLAPVSSSGAQSASGSGSTTSSASATPSSNAAATVKVGVTVMISSLAVLAFVLV